MTEDLAPNPTDAALDLPVHAEPGPMPPIDPAAPWTRLVAESRGSLMKAFERSRKIRLEPLSVHVADVGGIESRRLDTRHLVRALRERSGIRTQSLNRAVAAPGAAQDGRTLTRVADTIRDWLARSGGDLFVWGEVPSPGTTLHVRCVSAAYSSSEPGGAVEPAFALGLPVDFGPELADLLHVFALVAATPRSETQRRSQFYRVAAAFRSVRGVIQRLPSTLTSFERATARAAFGDVATFLAQAPKYRALLGDAVSAYEAARRSLNPEDAPLAAAIVARNLGSALLTGAASTPDARVLRTAVGALRDAVDGFVRGGLRAMEARARDQLGVALFRLDETESDPALLLEAIANHRAALAILSPERAPAAWAATQYNLARAAQVLGAQTESPDWVRQAIDAAHAALAVRSREQAPLAWAGIQNTLGSALFLLGRLERDSASVKAAAEALSSAHATYAEHGAEAPSKMAARNLKHVERFRPDVRAHPQHRESAES